MPVAERRVRLFLAYSLYFGLETLVLALREPVRMLGQGEPLKISREQVAAVVELLDRAVDSPEVLRAEYHRQVAALQHGVHPDWPDEVTGALATWHAALRA
jgi:hypothetical protein